jgi:predicted aldo/keto reductase-like oxidoreductase
MAIRKETGTAPPKLSLKQNKPDGVDRRRFIGRMGAMALGSALPSFFGRAKAASAAQQVPRRTLGRTGDAVPIVGLGCIYDFTELHHLLDGALRYGVAYWDTATNYSRTKSQLGIGQYLEKHSDVRKRLFLISKPTDLETRLPVIADLEKDLHESLERAKTDHFDVYCAVHAMWNPDQLTDELREWAESCKKRGLFKYLGYSAHRNVPRGLEAAAKCGWVDVVLAAYNFQLMQDEEYQRAIDAAHKAGIGLIAIKTQRKVSMKPMSFESEADKKLAEHFLERGYTEGQAKLKIVLEDERFTAAAVGMKDPDILAENAAAAMDRTKLTHADKAALKEYADATCHMYCTGCSHICDGVLPDVPFVNHIMRYVMYHDSYGQHARARELFARIPSDVRSRLLSTDYSLAEARCPQHLPIARIVAEAVRKLA